MRPAFPRKLVPASVRHAIRCLLGREQDVSTEHQVIQGALPLALLHGFAHPTVAERQHRAFAPLLQQLRAGKTREDFAALAKAVDFTGLPKPLVVEVGCGSGWNAEVLKTLLKDPVHYIGLDYSSAMTRLGKRNYPIIPFVVGDATRLPFKDHAVDVLISGTVLMHLLEYRQAIRESRRVARRWCIFHTVPVLQQRTTTLLRKEAYGQPTIEVVFNEKELCEVMAQNGLTVRKVINSLPYDLAAVLGESTVTKTYVCEITTA